MIKRIVTAFAFAPFILLIIYKSAIGFFLLISVIGLLSLSEIYTIIELSKKGSSFGNIYANAGYIAFLSIMLIFYIKTKFELFDVISLLFISISIIILLKHNISQYFDICYKTIVPVVYISMLGYFIKIYNMSFNGNFNGNIMITFIILCLWSSDSAAYFWGIKFGNIKLYPEVSPKKSVQGAYAGFLGPIICFFLLSLFSGEFPLLFSVLAGIIIGIIGQIGDLSESCLKRQFSVKDSSSILPGHGGILDRFDSAIFIAPVIYWFIRFYF